jgi:putative sigma-54 modulation protein
VQINITARHGSLSDINQQLITAKVEKLQRFLDRVTSIKVVVDLQEPERPRVDVDVTAEHANDFVAHDQSDNLLSSVEAVVQKLEQQLRKFKEKQLEKHRKGDPHRMEIAPVEPAEVEDE